MPKSIAVGTLASIDRRRAARGRIVVVGISSPSTSASVQIGDSAEQHHARQIFTAIQTSQIGVPSLAVMHPHAGLLGAAAYAADAERDAPGVAA